MEDFDRISRRISPISAISSLSAGSWSISTGGRGPCGTRALLDAGLLHGDVMTVTGRTMAENLEGVNPPSDPSVIRSVDAPLAAQGDRSASRLARPEGAVVKVAGIELERFSTRTRIRRRAGRPGRPLPSRHPPRRGGRDPVRGTVGRTWMREMLQITAGHQGCRFGPRGAPDHRREVLGCHHRSLHRARRPRGGDRGPLALVADGDKIVLDLAARRLDLMVDDADLDRRRAAEATGAPIPQRCACQIRSSRRIGRARGRHRLSDAPARHPWRIWRPRSGGCGRRDPARPRRPDQLRRLSHHRRDHGRDSGLHLSPRWPQRGAAATSTPTEGLDPAHRRTRRGDSGQGGRVGGGPVRAVP